MEFTNSQFKLFREDLKEALKEVELKYDIQLTAGNISYDPYEGTFTVSLKAINNEAKEEQDAQARRNPLYGKTFIEGRHSFKIVGFGKGKYPINCERDDGKKFSFTRSAVEQHLEEEGEL